jgi:hypothetical protein
MNDTLAWYGIHGAGRLVIVTLCVLWVVCVTMRKEKV